ncbi:MAG: hypothetical protein SF162_00060 [bacterium]|nr:hypothetical protein [bacterium]
MNIRFDQIGELLSLGSGPELLISLLLYIIFFLALLVLFLLPDKNMPATLLTAGVLLSAIVVKLSLAAERVRGADPIIQSDDILMLALNAIMFTFPFIAAGVTRKARLSRGVKSTFPAILTGLFGGVHFFLFWLFYQRV